MTEEPISPFIDDVLVIETPPPVVYRLQFVSAGSWIVKRDGALPLLFNDAVSLYQKWSSESTSPGEELDISDFCRKHQYKLKPTTTCFYMKALEGENIMYPFAHTSHEEVLIKIRKEMGSMNYMKADIGISFMDGLSSMFRVTFFADELIHETFNFKSYLQDKLEYSKVKSPFSGERESCQQILERLSYLETLSL